LKSSQQVGAAILQEPPSQVCFGHFLDHAVERCVQLAAQIVERRQRD